VSVKLKREAAPNTMSTSTPFTGAISWRIKSWPPSRTVYPGA
jgi:hypothetical protein